MSDTYWTVEYRSEFDGMYLYGIFSCKETAEIFLEDLKNHAIKDRMKIYNNFENDPTKQIAIEYMERSFIENFNNEYFVTEYPVDPDFEP